MKKAAFALSMTALSCLFSVSASATPVSSVTITGMEYSPSTTVTITSTQGPLSEYVYAGGFATVASNAASAFETWCVDIFKNAYFNETVLDYDAQSSLTALGATKTGLLDRLATESLGLVNDATTSSAFQLAIWELMNETGSTYTLDSGSFSASGASDQSIALANTWLTNLPDSTAPVLYDITVLVSPTRQNLAYFTAVPEPSSIALLAVGLLGFTALRRKSANKA